MKIAYIYGLSAEDGVIRYVGKTYRLNKRLHEHRKLRGKRSHKNNWIASVLERGGDLQIHNLEEIPHENDAEWVAAEEFWIKYLKFLGCPLTNTYEKSLAGWDRSPEFSARLAERNLRRPNEVNEKIAKTLTGRKLPEEQAQKHRDRVNSPEWKARMSELHKGKILNEAQKKGLEAGRNMERTPEYRETLSKSLKGKKKTPEHLESIRLSIIRNGKLKGRAKTPEHIEKIRLSQKGKKRGPMSAEARSNMAKAQQAAMMINPRKKTGPMTSSQIENLVMKREATKILKILTARQII